MWLKYILFVLLTIFACKHENNRLRKAEKIYSKIKQEDLSDFFKVTFGQRGKIELWTYYFSSNHDSIFVWTYDRDKGTFELSNHPNFEKFKQEIKNPLEFAKKVKQQKDKFGVVGIFNSSYPVKHIKFWISDSDALVYMLDDSEEKLNPTHYWLMDYEKVHTLDDNWLYIDIHKR